VAGYILDTSAVMALLFEEDGASTVSDIIYGPDRVSLPFICLMEVEYRLLRFKPEIVEESLNRIDGWPIDIAESYYTWRRTAAQIKARGRISVADSWAAALALQRDAALVHKDPEFDAVADLQVVRLPYDRDAGARS
jgi:predicted nucleic acid-binding protein